MSLARTMFRNTDAVLDSPVMTASASQPITNTYEELGVREGDSVNVPYDTLSNYTHTYNYAVLRNKYISVRVDMKQKKRSCL